jgi:hypothetical protein
VIDIGQASDEKAIELGALALEEAQRDHFTGSVRLPRAAERNGVWAPTSLMRANDVIFDAENGRELPVLSTNYSRSAERPAEATIDTPANRLDAAIAEHQGRPRKLRYKRIRRRLRRQRRQSRQARREARREA